MLFRSPLVDARYGLLFWYKIDEIPKTRTGSLSKNQKTYSIWISNGETFTYFESASDQARAQASQQPTRNYLSPLLMSIFREIYHRLTLRRIKYLYSSHTNKQARLLQKLCYFLSTFPQMDRTTIDILNNDTIYNAVSSYIDSDTTDDQTEIDNIKNILLTISTEYTNFKLSTSIQPTISTNYIETSSDLATKLTKKYGSQVRIDKDIKLKYKHQLKYGPHALIGLSSFTVADKNIVSSTQLYNNMTITLGNIKYETNVDTSKSVIDLSITDTPSAGIAKMPLADIAITQTAPPAFNLGSGIYKSFPAGSTAEVKFSDLYTNANSDGTYYWEQISGPQCLRFNDYARDRFRIKLYSDSTYYNPDVYIRAPGTYKVKCTRNFNGILESEIGRAHV